MEPTRAGMNGGCLPGGKVYSDAQRSGMNGGCLPGGRVYSDAQRSGTTNGRASDFHNGAGASNRATTVLVQVPCMGRDGRGQR